MVNFPGHERGRVVVRGRGPARQGRAAKAAVPPAGVEPVAMGAGEDQDAAEGHDRRHQEVPGTDDVVGGGVFEPDEVEKGHVTGRGGGTRCDGPPEREGREREGDDDPLAEQPVGRFGDAGKLVHKTGAAARPAARRRDSL